jgi:hypothetical protein
VQLTVPIGDDGQLMSPPVLWLKYMTVPSDDGQLMSWPPPMLWLSTQFAGQVLEFGYASPGPLACASYRVRSIEDELDVASKSMNSMCSLIWRYGKAGSLPDHSLPALLPAKAHPWSGSPMRRSCSVPRGCHPHGDGQCSCESVEWL